MTKSVTVTLTIVDVRRILKTLGHYALGCSDKEYAKIQELAPKLNAALKAALDKDAGNE